MNRTAIDAVGAIMVVSVIVGVAVASLLLLLFWRQHRKANVQQARLAALVEGSNDAIIGQTLAGVVTDWNRAAERMFGYPAGEAIGRKALELIVPEEHQAEEAAFLARVGRGETVPHFTTRRRQRDGGELAVSITVSPLFAADGRIAGASKTVRDITAESAEHQRSLRERERLLRAITDNIPGMVGYWDADLKCRFANDAYRVGFGRTAAEMAAIRLPDLLGEDLFRASEPHVRRALQGHVERFERLLIRADGRPGHAWAHYIPDIDGDAVRGFYVLVFDITELKDAQISLEAANRTLEARTREAEAATVAKSQFLANMSHEIRTPMSALLGMLQLLSSTDLSVRQADYTAKASSAAGSLLHLLNDILDFSKIEAGKITLETLTFRIAAMMSDIGAGFSEVIGGKPVRLIQDIDVNVPVLLRGDAFRLRQVLTNLVGNAIKFTDRGEVRVSIQRVGGGRDFHDVEFSVRDTGVGIARDQHEAIFEGFTQAEASTTRRYGGSGLGLAISGRLVGLMGGDLKVESEPGLGSRFHFTLRLEAAQADTAADDEGWGYPPAAASVSAWDQRRLPGLRLLVVEDQEINRQVVRELLSGEGAIVDVADSGGVGVAMALAEPSAFDGILMDIQMPHMDGFEAAGQIRARAGAAAPPIIAMTAHAMASDRAACLAAGMADHIAKPIDLDHAVKVILTHCAPSPAPRAILAPPQGVDMELELDLALGRLGGNISLFRTIARMFLRDAPSMVDELAAALRTGSAPASCAMLHKFRGLAATVGLTTLAGLTAELEAEIGRSGGLADTECRIDTLRAHFAAGALLLQRRAESLADEAPLPPPPGPAMFRDYLPIAGVAEQLDHWLEGANMRAVVAHADLRHLCGAAFADHNLGPLAEAMDRLDFKRARQELNSLRSLWG